MEMIDNTHKLKDDLNSNPIGLPSSFISNKYKIIMITKCAILCFVVYFARARSWTYNNQETYVTHDMLVTRIRIESVAS